MTEAMAHRLGPRPLTYLRDPQMLASRPCAHLRRPTTLMRQRSPTINRPAKDNTAMGWWRLTKDGGGQWVKQLMDAPHGSAG